MASGAPSSEQLLELLKRAADELTAARGETEKVKAQAEADAKAYQAKEADWEKQRVRLQAQYDAEKAAHQELLDKADERTAMVIPQKGKKLRESAQEKSAREKAEEDLAIEKVNVDSLKQSLDQANKALEQEQQALAQLRSSQDIERQQALEAVERNLVASRQEVAELKEQLRAEQARGGEALAEVQSEHDAVKARVEALEASQQVAESQRQELEKNHSLSLEEARQQQQQAEAASTQEREKHQATAQKLLAERQRTRELEVQVEELQKRVKELEHGVKAAAEVHQNLQQTHAMERAQQEARYAEQNAAREEHFAQLAAQLEASNNERYFVERKFEELHRELLVVLEQRDEARGQVAMAEAERARLERAMMQKR